MADVSINTVSKLLVDAGRFCQAFHDEMVRGVNAKRVQADEVWSSIAAKAKNVTPDLREQNPGAGDEWTWTAIDADSKLVIAYLVGARDGFCAELLMRDLESRIVADETHLTTDQLNVYLRAVDLAMRMSMRRFTRLTNGFSKKFENDAAMVAIYTVWCNWVRIHKTLQVTPAMEAKLADRTWSLEESVNLMDEVAKPVPQSTETLPPRALILGTCERIRSHTSRRSSTSSVSRASIAAFGSSTVGSRPRRRSTVGRSSTSRPTTTSV